MIFSIETIEYQVERESEWQKGVLFKGTSKDGIINLKTEKILKEIPCDIRSVPIMSINFRAFNEWTSEQKESPLQAD